MITCDAAPTGDHRRPAQVPYLGANGRDPAAIRADLVEHLAEFVDRSPNALVFTGAQGLLGMARVYFHDFRHAGNIWASKAGMSTKDLMARMEHEDMRAALVYQGAASDADRLIAHRLSALVDEHRGRTAPDKPSEDGSLGPVG